MPQPSDTITAPAPTLRIATADGRAQVGVVIEGVVRWAEAVVPAPLQLIAEPEDVAYHQMWSGVLAVALPCWRPLCVWLCDGELQVLCLTLDASGLPQLELA